MCWFRFAEEKKNPSQSAKIAGFRNRFRGLWPWGPDGTSEPKAPHVWLTLFSLFVELPQPQVIEDLSFLTSVKIEVWVVLRDVSHGAQDSEPQPQTGCYCETFFLIVSQ